jgi:hypothetical protein
LSLLKTLQQTLSDDLPRLQELLDQGEVYAANRILHQKTLRSSRAIRCSKPTTDSTNANDKATANVDR